MTDAKGTAPTRLPPTTKTVRALFARSGNQCAFPGCTHCLVNEKNQFVGQICHIEGALPGGERYNPASSGEVRRSYENLILLCYAHHVETNDTREYSAEKLQHMKAQHETTFGSTPYRIDERLLHFVVEEMQRYWREVERLNTLEHSMRELALNIDAGASFFDIMGACRNNIEIIRSFHDQLHETEGASTKNWEIHNLGIPNRMRRLEVDLMQLELKYLEELLKTQPGDPFARERLTALKAEFKRIAQHETVID